jgi:5-formyltetrahydrofolate cyclo-ligase
MVHASAASAKTLLRAQMRAIRAAAARNDLGAAQRAADNLPSALLGQFATVAGYAPLSSEIDPLPLLTRLTRAGARLALPRTLDGQPLQFHLWQPGQVLTKSAFGVAEPESTAPLCEPDLILVPLLAFDRFGGRMGYGQGHYDRTLANLRRRQTIVALGLAYDAQEVANLPLEDHDETLDGILTEMRYIPVQRNP